MPDGAHFGRYADAGTNAAILRATGGGQGAMARNLWPHAFGSARFRLFDFDANALDTTYWTTNAGTGATAFASPATKVQDGAITGATGTNATLSNRFVNLYGDRIWTGNKGCGMEICFTSTRVSDLYFEVGWIDTMTSITTPSQVCTDTDIAAHTFDAGAGDVAIVARDSSQTLTTSVLATLGSSAVNTGATAAIGTYVPTITVKNRIRVQLDGNSVIVMIDNSDGAGKFLAQDNAINGATLVRPWFMIGGGSATTCSVNVDYIALWGDRS